MPVQPSLHGKQRQDRKRHHPSPLVRDRCVRQQSENDERCKCNQQAIHLIPRKISLGISAARFTP
jgi:hypothetical protein